MKKNSTHYKYDVALSFAGEQRTYVEKVALSLKRLGISFFYDNDNQVDLWGKNLIKYLSDVYINQSKYCVIFISKEYCKKNWTIFESEAAEERNFFSHDFEKYQQYILPVRFDNSEIPGLRNTWGYIDATKVTPEELAKKIAQKIDSSLIPNSFVCNESGDCLEYVFNYITSHLEAYFETVLDRRYEFLTEHLGNLWIGTYYHMKNPLYCISIRKLKLTENVNELLLYNGTFKPEDLETCFTARIRWDKNNHSTPIVFYNHGFDIDDLVRSYSLETMSNYLISNICRKTPNCSY